jgi:hypothetical protein
MHSPYCSLDIEEVVMDASFFNERTLAVGDKGVQIWGKSVGQ